MVSIVFLEYVISKKEVMVDQFKVEAIRSWPEPKTFTDAKSFHGLVSFYKRFVPNFSTLMALITECMKKRSFEWTLIASEAFELIKQQLCKVLILALLDFEKLFKVEWDTSEMGFGDILTDRKSVV